MWQMKWKSSQLREKWTVLNNTNKLNDFKCTRGKQPLTRSRVVI